MNHGHFAMTLPEQPADPAYPVFVRRGDATAELEQLLAAAGDTPHAAGLRKFFYVSRADQTVVMVVSRDAPLGRALRGRKGWSEPIDGS
jgi:hypothetical protein